MEADLFDIAVIGAGPVGNLAALRLAQMGYDVCVLDYRIDIGNKLCTGIVGQDFVKRYEPYPDHIFQPARSTTIVAPSGKTHYIETSTPQAYVIDRVAFVESMARRASEAGATYLLGERVVGLDNGNSEVALWTSTPEGPRKYRARAVVIANGFSSSLVQLAGLPERRPRHYMIGQQAAVETRGVSEIEVHMGGADAPGSFAWVVPTTDGQALIGHVARPRASRNLGRLIDSLRQQGRVTDVIDPPSSWGIPIQPLAQSYGDRTLVIGDAAGYVKPVTGGGIYYGMLTAETAAEVLADSMRTGDLSAANLRAYQTKVDSLLGKEMRMGYLARRLSESLSDSQVEWLLERLLSPSVKAQVVSAAELSFDWHSRVISRAFGVQAIYEAIKSLGPAVVPFLSRLVNRNRR